MRSPLRSVPGVLLALALLPMSGVSQGPDVLVQSRNHDPVVAVSARFPAGSRTDPADQTGAAFLFGRLVAQDGARRIAELSARIDVEVSRDEFLITLVAPADRWVEAWERLRELAESSSFPEQTVAGVRERHRGHLVFEAGAPGRTFDIEEAAFLFGASDPAARPVAGSLEGLENLDPAALADARDRVLDWGSAVVALVGPIEPSEAEAVFGAPAERLGRAPEPAPDTLSPADSVQGLPPVRIARRSSPLRAPAPVQGAAGAWGAADRRVIHQDITSTWITIAWPIPRGSPLVLQDFLVHLIDEALNPELPHPDVYWAEVEVLDLRGDPVLRVSGSTDPRHALAWEQEVLSLLDELSQSPPDGAFFDLARRRYRTLRLLDHAVPEERARWIVRARAHFGSVPDLPADVWGLTRDEIASLARGRGEARILLFGPENLMSDGSSP